MFASVVSTESDEDRRSDGSGAPLPLLHPAAADLLHRRREGRGVHAGHLGPSAPLLLPLGAMASKYDNDFSRFQKIIEEIDADGSGEIEFPEFLQMMNGKSSFLILSFGKI